MRRAKGGEKVECDSGGTLGVEGYFCGIDWGEGVTVWVCLTLGQSVSHGTPLR